MRQMSAQDKRLLLIGAAAVVVFAYVFGLLLPLHAKARELASEQESLSGLMERAQMMYSAAQAAEADLAELASQTHELMFPEGDVRVSMVRQLESLATETGLTITRVRPEEPQSIEGSVKYRTTFTVEASFSEVVRLMFKLEEPTRRLWVEGVEISADRQAGDRVQATFYVAAYGRTPESEGADAQA